MQPENSQNNGMKGYCLTQCLKYEKCIKNLPNRTYNKEQSEGICYASDRTLEVCLEQDVEPWIGVWQRLQKSKQQMPRTLYSKVKYHINLLNIKPKLGNNNNPLPPADR